MLKPLSFRLIVTSNVYTIEYTFEGWLYTSGMKIKIKKTSPSMALVLKMRVQFSQDHALPIVIDDSIMEKNGLSHWAYLRGVSW